MAFNTQQFIQQIFASNVTNFNQLVYDAFIYQYNQNAVYRQFCQCIGYKLTNSLNINNIPFLPIDFFKSYQIVTNGLQPQKVFASSSTTGKGQSLHYVSDLELYEKSFLQAFNTQFGSVSNYHILALLPGYLERTNSSLVHMVNVLMQKSNKPFNNFYLNNYTQLYSAILNLETLNHPYILFGVTHALLDFAHKYKPKLNNGIIIETGGMKGKRKEMVREELYHNLCNNFGVKTICSEYGMTELLSQAYSKQNGRYLCPPWMQVFISDINDPFTMVSNGKTGIINIIDLANINSCCFIQTADIGKINNDGTFDVLGRMDYSDIRGCSLMVV